MSVKYHCDNCDKKIGVPYSEERLNGYLKRVDDFYIGDGWYSDGKDREQRDYYTPFGIYYYGLIYAAIMQDEDPEICGHFKERARLFAKDFKDWFAADGSALPFGRSLTYRFAQSAFWGALAFADVEGLPWPVIKGLYMRNLRWWFAQPIFTSEGLLTIGYRYPNLNMSEGYNAPGSPYWALKAFLPLALPEEHPFWQAEEAPLPDGEYQRVQTHPHMIICHSDSRKHLFALHSGQWPKTQFVHNTAKYGKFVYSNVFGFSVPREAYGLSQGAYDSTLALSEGDGIYRTRRDCIEYKIDGDVVYSLWKPWDDVEVLTGKTMKPGKGKKKTILFGKCIYQANKDNPDIKEMIAIKGCPPKPETVYKALQKAGIDVDRKIFQNLDMIPGKFLKRYKDKPEFDESLFKIYGGTKC